MTRPLSFDGALRPGRARRIPSRHIIRQADAFRCSTGFSTMISINTVDQASTRSGRRIRRSARA
jgi:hypothetical protein